jgi:hypothetical protein
MGLCVVERRRNNNNRKTRTHSLRLVGRLLFKNPFQNHKTPALFAAEKMEGDKKSLLDLIATTTINPLTALLNPATTQQQPH